LKRSLELINRVTGNSSGSLGLHPAVYFYNDRGKYSRFLFLGMTALITERIRSNDSMFFQKFSRARRGLEAFLFENKSLITNVLQNLAKSQRVNKIKSLFGFLVNEYDKGRTVSPEVAITHIGLRGRIFDVNARPCGRIRHS
jgi:hypothetical protein